MEFNANNRKAGGLTVQRYVSPVGALLLGEWEGKIVMCDWEGNDRHPSALEKLIRHTGTQPVERLSDVITLLIKELDEYFGGGGRKDFDLPIKLLGTPFQSKVWMTLKEIPYGTCITYSELAKRVGCKCVRAVAGAVGANPASIIIPCHRVVGSGGILRGYAGGIEAQRSLISLEMRNREKFTLP